MAPPAGTDGARGPQHQVLAKACVQLTEYFAGQRHAFDVPIDWSAGVAAPPRMMAWLVRQQDRDGGFNFAGAGATSDVDDTGGALEALAGGGQQADGARRRAIALSGSVGTDIPTASAAAAAPAEVTGRVRGRASACGGRRTSIASAPRSTAMRASPSVRCGRANRLPRSISASEKYDRTST